MHPKAWPSFPIGDAVARQERQVVRRKAALLSAGQAEREALLLLAQGTGFEPLAGSSRVCPFSSHRPWGTGLVARRVRLRRAKGSRQGRVCSD